MSEAALRARISQIDTHIVSLHNAQRMVAPIADAGRRLSGGAANARSHVNAVIGGTMTETEARLITRLSTAEDSGRQLAARIAAALTSLEAARARLARERDHLEQELHDLEAARRSQR